MNKRGGIISSIVMIIIFIGLIFIAFCIRTIGTSTGFHNGVVTAVEHNSNILWDSDLVYFKSDAQSTQEDRYCVNDEDLKNKLLRASNANQRVTIKYSNDFLLWVWECNGGESIIYAVEGQE